LVRLVTRSTKARFGQVSDQVSQVKDQVGQGQGQEHSLRKCSKYSSYRLQSEHMFFQSTTMWTLDITFVTFEFSTVNVNMVF